jgi:ribosomal protein S27E
MRQVRQVVVAEDLAEAAVHPHGMHGRLVRAFVQAAEAVLRKRADFIDVPCPACGSSETSAAFAKHGYRFQECDGCGSLFTSPRPTLELMDSYFFDSAAASFRSGDEYREALSSRNAELARHRADWLASICDRAGPPAGPVVVYEPGSPDLLDELVRSDLGPVIAVRPLFEARSAAAEEQEWAAVDDLSHGAASGARLVTVLDVLERQVDPSDILAAASSALVPGGCLALTTRCGSGFDIQVAWERATVFPTVEGMEALLDGLSFEVLELSTPGQLDVQIVERLAAEEGVELPRVVRYFMANRDQDAKLRLQQFLQENLLSSHLRVVARRPAARIV